MFIFILKIFVLFLNLRHQTPTGVFFCVYSKPRVSIFWGYILYLVLLYIFRLSIASGLYPAGGYLLYLYLRRLRGELTEVQLVRRHLLEENNDMQKKLNYENDAIPRMEKELKVLADENNYLKLLCES